VSDSKHNGEKGCMHTSILEAWFQMRIFKPKQVWIDDQFFEVGIQELLFLLLVPPSTVNCI
jgi:hypothetical protein